MNPSDLKGLRLEPHTQQPCSKTGYHSLPGPKRPQEAVNDPSSGAQPIQVTSGPFPLTASNYPLSAGLTQG